MPGAAPVELPLVVADKLISDGGWIERQGVSTFNLYRPPSITLGDAKKAKPWTDLVRKVYPDDADEIFNFFAHRGSGPRRKSTTRWCSAVNPASARTPCLRL